MSKRIHICFLVFIFAVALTACQSNTPPVPKPTPFTVQLDAASTTVVEGSYVLLQSVTAGTRPEGFVGTPLWTIQSGLGELRTVKDVPDAAVLNFSTGGAVRLESRYASTAVPYAATLELKTVSAPTILPSAGATVPALALKTQSFPWTDEALIVGTRVYATGSTFINGGASGQLTIRRYSRAGTIDVGFASNGLMTISLSDLQTSNQRFQIAADSSANLYVLTYTMGVTTIRKFDVNGAPIVTFGSAGTTTVNNSLRSGGRLQLILGEASNSLYIFENNLDSGIKVDTVTRLDTRNGTSDATFGTLTLPSKFLFGRPVIRNGELWVVGSILAGQPSGSSWFEYGLLKITPSGTLDPSFGTGGIAQFTGVVNRLTGLGRSEQWLDVVVQGDGSILAFGNTRLSVFGARDPFGLITGSVFDAAYTVTRLFADGKPDTSFGVSGISSINSDGLRRSNDDRFVRGFVRNGKPLLIAQRTPAPDANALAFVIAEFTSGGMLEHVSRGSYDANTINLSGDSFRNPTGALEVAILEDGAVFVVATVNLRVAPNGDTRQLGFVRY